MRYFEKINFEQFKKDVKDDEELYSSYSLPKRTSQKAAGYNFFLIEDVTINPGETLKIPTGIKSFFEDDEVLFIIVRSSMGFKYNIRLCNQVGVIDADYYNNENNNGHMWIKIKNEGDLSVTFKSGDCIAQGIFMKYLTTSDDFGNDLKRQTNY